MLDLPKSTVFNKRIPKQKLYEKLGMSNYLKQQFVKEIETVNWKNKLSPDTLNISAGANVTEIEFFEIVLKQQSISKNVIEMIDREIPYHIVFVLRYKELGQIWISFKENSKSHEGKFKVNSYYITDWLEYEELSLKIEGLDLDKVYENFMLQAAGDKLQMEIDNKQLTIKEAIEKSKEKKRLEAVIINLENKIKNEKQFNQQVKLMGELRKAREKLSAE